MQFPWLMMVWTQLSRDSDVRQVALGFRFTFSQRLILIFVKRRCRFTDENRPSITQKESFFLFGREDTSQQPAVSCTDRLGGHAPLDPPLP